MKVGAIIQARMSSTRLPGKVLKELPYNSGITVLEQVIRRLKKSKNLKKIVVATTTEKSDKVIINIAKKENIRCFRGSKEDVLSRYYFAAKENDLDVVVRITGDCPCVDPEIVDLIITKHIEAEADFTTNCFKRTYPHGLDVESFNFNILKEAHANAHNAYEKEHVTPHISGNPNVYNIIQVEAPRDLYAPKIRITLDTEEDYALLCVIFDHLYIKNEYFNAYDIVNLFKEKPWLCLINKKSLQKKAYNSFKEECQQAIKALDLHGLKRVSNFLRKQLNEDHNLNRRR